MSVLSRNRTEYGVILAISPYSVRMRENTDQKNSKYGRFSRSDRKKRNFEFHPFCANVHISLHKKWSFPLRISSINVAKSGFGHIYWRNAYWKNSFFVHFLFQFFPVFFKICWKGLKLMGKLGYNRVVANPSWKRNVKDNLQRWKWKNNKRWYQHFRNITCRFCTSSRNFTIVSW